MGKVAGRHSVSTVAHGRIVEYSGRIQKSWFALPCSPP